MKRPGNSPDLNPIGNVWSLMKMKLRDSTAKKHLGVEKRDDRVIDPEAEQQQLPAEADGLHAQQVGQGYPEGWVDLSLLICNDIY
jgi:hypothetical protein